MKLEKGESGRECVSVRVGRGLKDDLGKLAAVYVASLAYHGYAGV